MMSQDMRNILSSVQDATKAVSVNEFQMINARVARVIATVTGRMSREETIERLTATLKNAAPVVGSFRWLQERASMVGYVSINHEVRAVEPTTIQAKYRVVAGNLYMDASDESLWEMKDGAGGKYLTRQGHDELAELLEASRNADRGFAPRIRSLVQASAKKQELVAFVSANSNVVEMDYGFCIEAGNRGEQRSYKVLSTTSNTLVEVPSDLVVGVYTVEQPVVAGAKPITAALDKAAMVEYYKKAYGYAPEYLNKILQQIDEMSAA